MLPLTASKSMRRFSPFLASLLLSATAATNAHAGGFGLVVELASKSASATGGASPQDAVLVVHAIGCHGPGAVVAAKAEGILEGKRVSLPLRLEPLGQDRYALSRQWPRQGVWVISLYAKAAAQAGSQERHFYPITQALVECGPDGNALYVQPPSGPEDTRQKVRVHYVSSSNKAQTIEDALKRLAGRGRAADAARQPLR